MVKLINIGNTCYINSILQLFFNFKNSKPLGNNKASLLFQKIIEIVQDSTNKETFNPKPLLDYLNWNSKFRFGLQHDAHESFMYLIEKLGDNQFRGQTIDFMYTLNETYEVHFNKQIFVSLEIAVVSNCLLDCINKHFQIERINDWKDTNGNTRNLMKTVKINHLPNKLLIVLRQPFNKKVLVKLPIILDFTKYCIDDNTIRKFIIRSIVVHKGCHYYTLVFKNRSWKKYDDDHICDMTPSEVSHESPYLILYETIS